MFLADSKWEFAAAILILGVSDALAAIVGKKYGKNSGYLVFGQKKSVVGSIAFFCSALIIVTGFAVVTGISFTISTTLLVLVTTLLVTITENLGVYGSDNLLIPLVAVVLLNRL